MDAISPTGENCPAEPARIDRRSGESRHLLAGPAGDKQVRQFNATMIESHVDPDGVELTERNEDTWLAVLLDLTVCTVLFAAATIFAGAFITAVVEPFVNPQRALVYVPIWLVCMLVVPYYARWRGRLRFTTVDLVWWCPALIALLAAMESFGTSSIFVPLTGYGVYFLSICLRSNLGKKSELPS